VEGTAPKVVAILMILAVAALVVPILNLVEKTKVQGIVNDYLTLQNGHILKEKKVVEDYLYDTIEETIGTDKDAEVIMYAYQGSIPFSLVSEPGKIPNIDGIKKQTGYYQVSALVTRVYWVQQKLIADKLDPDGNPIGKCFMCNADTMIDRVLFIPNERLGTAYRPASSDLDFVQDPSLLFAQF